METQSLGDSIAAAIEAGVTWSPQYFSNFQAAAATARSGAHAGDAGRAVASRSLSGGTMADPAPNIPADLLRCIFSCCESDGWRIARENGASEIRKEQDNGCGGYDRSKIIVAHFGVRIEDATIAGYLDLSGLIFKRPISFVNCRFTHTVNLANARLGPVSFEKCVFDAAPNELRKAIARYPLQSANKPSIGYLPQLMMFAQGINAQGVSFEGYVDLTGLHAQRLDFFNANFSDLLDIEHAKILLPRIDELENAYPDEDLPVRAIDLSTARGRNFNLLRTQVEGQLWLWGASFDAIYIIDSSVRAHESHFGSRGVAIFGQDLRTESSLWIKNSDSPVSDSGQWKPHFWGGLDFEQSKFGGEVKIEGVTIDLALSDEHKKVLRECSRRNNGLSYHERRATRAIILRNCCVGGMLKFSKTEPTLHDLGGGHKRGTRQHDHPVDQLFVCNGELDLRSIDVEDDVRFEGCLLTNDSFRRTVIDLRDSKIGRVLLLKNMDKDCDGDIDLREARAAVYRDDFDHVYDFPKFLKAKVGGAIGLLFERPAFWAMLILGASLLLQLNSAILYIAALAIVVDLPLSWRSFFRKLSVLWNAKQTWPRNLKFALSGFVYDALPIRDSAPTSDNSDSSRMPLTNGARLRWLLQQDRAWLEERFQPQPWIQCARVLTNLGYDRQAHQLLRIRESRALISDNVGLPEKLIRMLLVVTCGGGHDMLKLILLGGSVFIVTFFLNGVAINANLMRPNNVPLLINQEYRNNGKLPYEYAKLEPLSFTLRNMVPLPAAVGGGEWVACTGRQIRQAIEIGSNGACVPKKCSISDGDCDRLTISREAGISADVVSVLPERTRSIIENLSAAEMLNQFFTNGGSRWINAVAAGVSWLVLVLLGMYATGSLKRQE